MRIALIADTFPPLRTSGAVQLRDLSRELVRQGHQVTVLLPSAEPTNGWMLEDYAGVQVLRLKAPKTKDINYVSRTINEFVMPFAMLRQLRKSPLANQRWDGVVWYAPSIFFGPLAKSLKTSSGCKSYLIVRDIFPEWAVDMGLMGRGLPYRFFNAVAQYQYSVADVIGIQTEGNRSYFAHMPPNRVEVLQNWLADAPKQKCSISIANSKLAGRFIFVYAGNMGVAQGMGVLLELAAALISNANLGFLFVGRGSDANRLSQEVVQRGLNNVEFHDEIDPDEIPGLYAQCHVGIVALDPRHQTHNIPGKFLSYMQSGLPVLANINPGNDLVKLIKGQQVGAVSTSQSVGDLQALALELLKLVGSDPDIANRCKILFRELFSAQTAAVQITKALR